MNTTELIKTFKCGCTFMNCNCWYVIAPDNTLIHRGESYDEANKWRLSQPDAATLKMTPWANGQEVQERDR